MTYFLFNLSLWSLVVYSLRVAVLGNPLHQCVVEATPEELQRAEQITLEGRDPVSDTEIDFVRRFSRLTMLEFAAFLLEMGLLIYLVVMNQWFWLSLGLLLKNMLVLGLSAGYARAVIAGNLFQSLRHLPVWYLWLDRGSALISAVGLLILFLMANQLSFW